MSQGVAPSTGGRRRRSRRNESAPQVGPGTDVGSYVVETRLGSGGFGTVFLARRGEQRYAVKLVSLSEVGEWGVREVLALSRVNHPNVAGLRGFWRWPEGAPRFLVVAMQYVRGRRLDEWAREENPSALQVLRLVLSLARALEAVHQARVVHLDVKPANILVSEEDGEPVLVDFGVSGWEESSGMTGYVVPLGTPSHRSPESWRFQHERGKPPGARYRPTPADDLYALGVVLYFLLTDGLPFCVELDEGPSAVMTQPPVPPHERNARVPLELSQLCLRLLDKQPETRLGTLALRQQAQALLEQRSGEQWEGPLCEAFSVHNQTTRAGPAADEGEAWLKRSKFREQRPRRGTRLPHEGEGEPDVPESAPAAVLPEPVAPLPAASPALPGPEQPAPDGGGPATLAAPVPSAGEALAQPVPRPGVFSTHGTSTANRGVLTVGLRLLATLSMVLLFRSPEGAPTEPAPPAQPPSGLALKLPTWQGGWKVAPPLKPPEAEPLAPALGPAKEEASVTSPQQQKPRRPGAVKKAAVVACTTIACASPQVIPPPPEPKPCPAGAVETMAKFGIAVDDRGSATFHIESADPSWLKVSAGWTQVRTGGWEDLPGGTLLVGELFLDERVYGRFTQARTPEGKTYPVCVELYEDGGPRGNDRRDDGKGTTAEMHSSVDVVAVDGFK